MKYQLRIFFLLIYTVVFLILFWNAHRFLECVGFFCAFLPTIGIWIAFIGLTILVLRLRPLTFKQTFIRFGIATVIAVLIYAFYYNCLMESWSSNPWFYDYSLPGLMLTVAYSGIWFVPTK